LKEYHDSPSAGNFGERPTYARLAAAFLWPGAHKFVQEWIKNCPICQHNKYLPKRKQGLLQPLDTPKQIWEDLSIDFITHLPNSFGHTAV